MLTEDGTGIFRTKKNMFDHYSTHSKLHEFKELKRLINSRRNTMRIFYSNFLSLTIIKKYKYKSNSGFIIKLSDGSDAFILDKIGNPYSESLFRLLTFNTVSDFSNISRPLNGVILIRNSGYQTYKTKNEFSTFLKKIMNMEDVEIEFIMNIIEKRKNEKTE